ncbi:hypothetical protein H4R99_005109 [Coemansia sp. RSA 1722]|nr:hypothetical protein LPJ57_003427 [Coemansia sp. RSA 486]KAJ1878787.1 hypothetical protein LPJ57_003213 [Coemansia sp. RSA 486]KAJ2595983.1 hypothetical protein H4R99_005109 [Coemansia sp. RSA 1722]KAJ2705442.1 hypothetical protein FB645_002425 [Coemansia sp. IMI 203386]
MARKPGDKPDASEECVLAKIVMYTCKKGETVITCKPFERLFKRCPGVPAVELVPGKDSFYVEVKMLDGASQWKKKP